MTTKEQEQLKNPDLLKERLALTEASSHYAQVVEYG